MTISPEGGRVLGSLAEKLLTTPQQYPLTMNVLVLACNQATNREPVMALEDETVQRALTELKERRLVRFVLPSHGKSVTRYRQVLEEVYGLDRPRLALLAVLLLRGPQTPGDLRARTGRMAEFDSVGRVQEELEALAGNVEPLVRVLPRRPGQKEDRWRQLLAAETSAVAVADGPELPTPSEGDEPHGRPPVAVPAEQPLSGSAGGRGGPGDLEARIERMEAEVAEVRGRIDELNASLDALRRSLGD